MAWITDNIHSITDPLHITDSKAAERAYDALNVGNANAVAQLNSDMIPSLDILGEAAYPRYLEKNLDIFDDKLRKAEGRTDEAVNEIWDAADAGERTEDFINPYAEQMETTAVNKMQGGLGSYLQSSGGQRKMADMLNQMGNQMWDTAFQQALGDSQNRVDAAGTYAKTASQYADMSGRKLENENQPALDLLNLKNDIAMQKYAGNVALGQVGAVVAGQNRSLL